VNLLQMFQQKKRSEGGKRGNVPWKSGKKSLKKMEHRRETLLEVKERTPAMEEENEKVASAVIKRSQLYASERASGARYNRKREN